MKNKKTNWFFWEDPTFRKYKHSTSEKVPNFIISLTFLILILALIIGSIVLIIDRNEPNINVQVGEFFGWYIGIIIISVLCNYFIFRHINIDHDRLKRDKAEIKKKRLQAKTQILKSNKKVTKK